MSQEVTGVLHVIYPGQQVSEKFKKREFVLAITEEINGNTYTNYAKMQMVQAECEILDRFKEGDRVKVNFNLKGNSYVDRKDGQTKYITNLDAWRIESAGHAQQQQAPASTYNTAPQPAHGPAQQYNQPGNFNPGPETADDLPF